MIDVDSKVEAEARIIDAASWLVKAAAQLGCISELHSASCELEKLAGDLLRDRKFFSEKGCDVALKAHSSMVKHALLNAAGHAFYAGAALEADQLLKLAGVKCLSV